MSIHQIPSILKAYPDEKPALLSSPEHVASISMLEDRQVKVDSDISLSVFCKPPLNADLAEGFERYRKLHRNNEFGGHPNRLDRILKAVLESNSSAALRKAQVITWRGIITKLCMLDKISLHAQYYRDVLYIEEHDPTPKRIEKVYPAVYQGHSFESLCTSGSSVNMDINKRWYSVILRDFGSLRIAMAGEIDCVKMSPGGSKSFLELKSCQISGSTELGSQRLKKFFLQSHLMGVPEIFVGYCGKGSSVLRSTDTISVDEIPEMIKRSSPKWIVETALSTAHRILAAVRDHCFRSQQAGESQDSQVWGFRLNANASSDLNDKSLDIWMLEHDDMRIINKGEDRFGILPHWFVDRLPAI